MRRAPSTTVAPSAERSRAVASPNPLLAPVITTILPLMFCIFEFFPGCVEVQGALTPRPRPCDAVCAIPRAKCLPILERHERTSWNLRSQAKRWSRPTRTKRSAKWIDEDLKLIGTRLDREVAKFLNRS
jgi:hypothetical protein